jgi:hypothetical protein
MGLLDTLGGKLNKNMADPLRMGLLAYGMTGQGQDPGGTAINTMMTTAKTKAEAEKAAREQAAKQAMQQQVTGAFASGSVDPALLAQYSAAGGEGSKEMLDLYKFGRTPQSVAPGQMMIDPTTGKMSMPAPKMGEGQMWDGGRVSEAQGYGDVMQQAINRDLQKYQQQEGIGYGYDVGRMGQQANIDLNKLGAQTQADIDKYRATSGIGYQYDRAKLQDAASLDPMSVYDPSTGQQVYANRGQVAGGGYQAQKSESEKILETEKAKAQSARFNDYMDKGGLAAKQTGKINQLENLIGSGLRTGSTQPAYDAVGGYLADAGIDVKGLSANQQASKMLLQLAQDIPLPPGAASNVDVQQRLQQLPQMTDTPEAFSASLQTMRSLAELNQDVAAYLNTVGTLTPEIEAEINSMYSEWGKGND